MTKTAKIVLGAWAWGDTDDYFGNGYAADHFGPVYAEAIKQGLNFWDTAYAYSKGNSETILGNLMKDTPRQDLVISTKFTPQLADDGAHPVQDMFKGSTQRLGTDYFDYYWIHNDDDVEKWTPQLIPLLQSGQIKHIGISNHTLPEIKRVQAILGAAGFKLDAVQNHLSLLDRTSEQAGILDYCHQNDIKFFAYMVLEQGALTGKYTVDHPFPATSARGKVYNPQLPQLTALIETLTKVGAPHQLSAAQTAMAWALAKGTIPIIGVTKVKQVAEAAQVAATALSAEEVKTLETAAAKTTADTIGFWEQDMRKDH
ncbi:aldo/keto reductase [Lactiplantibacillus sp. WILCCON 0030]|uniref:Aldo/keto reductase n=1 Tax=Lactiplantibacillus brownii TaxID=3069269 RepID=A0ABU1A8C3_9LACO|nr:aldo/keto reductase [Lactiplantibacillus brownii]MDQ7937208.1 aldo/keto reductase [Lactiplantibacillus brownii]